MVTVAQIITLLQENDRAIARALVALNARQTLDEQRDETTRYHNRRGFRPCHAKRGTGMADFYTRNGYLTEKQVNYWRKIMPGGKMRIAIYAGQLLIVAKEKAASESQLPLE